MYVYFQKCTVDNLSDKCLLQIFAYLHQRELGKIARVCKKWRLLAYSHQLWQVVSLRPEYNGLHVNTLENLMALINVRFGPSLRYIELPCDLVTTPILHELSNKCPALRYMTLDFSNAMQLHDFNDLNSFPCNLKSLCICLSEVIFLEGFMRRIYSCLSSLQVLHLIGKSRKTHRHIMYIICPGFFFCSWFGLFLAFASIPTFIRSVNLHTLCGSQLTYTHSVAVS